METTKLLNDDEMDSLVKRAWAASQEGILKQVEYAISNELSARARSRASILITKEVDIILKPKIESMKELMKERAQKIADNLLPRLEEAMKKGLEEAIKDVSEYIVRQILSQSEQRVRKAMTDALKPEGEGVKTA
jgi:hypothetical protein